MSQRCLIHEQLTHANSGKKYIFMLIIIAEAQTLDFMECDRCVLLFQGISSRASVESHLGILRGELNHT